MRDVEPENRRQAQSAHHFEAELYVMKRRERLMAILRGERVDRTPVSFYELNDLDENPEDSDPFNIYSDPSWRPLISRC